MAKMPAHGSRGEAQTPSVVMASGAAPEVESHASVRDHPSHRARTGMIIRGPESGRTILPFTLPDSDGQLVRSWSYRQRRNLVLFFHHGASCATCRALLHDLARSLEAFRDEEAVIFPIGPDLPAEAGVLARALSCAFPLLSDPAGTIAAQHGIEAPAVLVADRFGEIWAAWAGGAGHELPDVPEMIRWLEFIEVQCPECGVAEWPPQPTDVIMD